MDKETFINSVKDGALLGFKQFHILSSLTIAQAALESGWGQFKNGNNLFGSKWTEGCGYPSETFYTKEYINGQMQTVEDQFRVYPTLAESVYDHARILSQRKYSTVAQANDYKEACNAIQHTGYVTDPNYASNLIKIIEANDLQRFDVVNSPVLINPKIKTLQRAVNLTEIKDKNGNCLKEDGIRGILTNSAITKILITRGMKNELVKWIQQRLIILGFSYGKAGTDGEFDWNTLTIVQHFQASRGLKADGIVGPLTINALLK